MNVRSDHQQGDDAKGLPTASGTEEAQAARAAWQSDLWTKVQAWALELGFSQISVASLEPGEGHESVAQRLTQWLADGKHGDMHYLERHAALRLDPRALVPQATRALMVRMDYVPRARAPLEGLDAGRHALTVDVRSATEREVVSLPSSPASTQASLDNWQAVAWHRLQSPVQANVSLYARGRDYHKVVRQRLQRLADRITQAVGPFGHRAFADSAPIMEVELAARSGLAWRGKHTLALSRSGGSMFFLGALLTDLPLEPTAATDAHCGHCQACIDACPTRAITAPYQLDARRCIAYLTIEHHGPIPLELREAIGNRIFGCDDCQLVCPWNKYAQRATLADFDEREPFGATSSITLLELWGWHETDYLRRTEGSVLRRIGFERWRRNLAVAMGNALRHPNTAPSQRDDLRRALATAQVGETAMVTEHVQWALHGPPTTTPSQPTRGAMR